MSTPYALTVEVASFTGGQLDRIERSMDVVASEGHGPSEMTLFVEAGNALAAAQTGCQCLDDAGVTIRRLLPDLVNRADIAERAAITTQAVGNYVRGARGDGFPTPYYDVASGIWLWGEVLPWLRAQGVAVDDPSIYLTRSETESVMCHIWSRSPIEIRVDRTESAAAALA